MTLVLGGGIGGLSAAYYLLKNSNKKVLIAEASKTLGGWIQSVKDPDTGVVFEKGPRTLRLKGGAQTLSLIEELGLGPKVKPLTADSPASKNRLLYINNQLHYFPASLSVLFKTTPPFSKPLYSSILKDIFTPKKVCSDDSIYDFVRRRFDKEIADYLISSMICGICAGDAKQISVKLLMPYLFDCEQQHGSVIIGFLKDKFGKKENSTAAEPELALSGLNKKANDEKWTIFCLEGGLDLFPIALSEKIIEFGGEIKLNSPVTKLNLMKNSVKYTINGQIKESDHAISSLPAKTLSPLLKEEHPWLAEQLGSISFVTVAVVNVAYKGNVLKHNAFGYLIPPSENHPILGVIFDTCTLPQGDYTILTAMMGGTWYDKFFTPSTTPEEFLNVTLKYNKEILGIEEKPVAHHSKLMENCIAQYTVGHQEKVDNIFNYIKDNNLPLSLIGSSYRGVGVNDVITSARTAVGNLISKQI